MSVGCHIGAVSARLLVSASADSLRSTSKVHRRDDKAPESDNDTQNENRCTYHLGGQLNHDKGRSKCDAHGVRKLI